MAMTGFIGFPTGKNPYVPVPEIFFAQVLPAITDIAELKVTLHLFWRLAQKQSELRCISRQELQADALLLNSLKRLGDPRPAEEFLSYGLEQAMVRGTLLSLRLTPPAEIDDNEGKAIWYFFNTARSKKIIKELEGTMVLPVDMLATGKLTLQMLTTSTTRHALVEPDDQREEVRVQLEQVIPNLFAVYERNMGLLTPMVASEIKDALEYYPADWIEEAIKEAAQRNKCSWRYTHAILKRWQREGR